MEEKVIPHSFHEDLPHMVSFYAKAKFVKRSNYCCQDCKKCLNFVPKSKQCQAVSLTINYPLFQSGEFFVDNVVSF